METRYFIGVVLLLLGVGYLIEAIYAIPIVGTWWPLLVVLLGINQLARHPARPWWPLTIILIGVFIQLRILKLLPVNLWAAIGALLLIIIGIRLLLPHRKSAKMIRNRAAESTGSNLVNASVSFNERTLVSTAEQFQGGTTDVSFGSLVLDFSRANLSPEGADLALSVNFGSIKVRVPESWPLVISGSIAVGAIEVRARNAEIAVPGQAALRLACTGAFGGIEITN
ncbi:MAG: LiaF transmembrane domain-containing protein [Armatimonadota bacterium]